MLREEAGGRKPARRASTAPLARINLSISGMFAPTTSPSYHRRQGRRQRIETERKAQSLARQCEQSAEVAALTHVPRPSGVAAQPPSSMIDSGWVFPIQACTQATGARPLSVAPDDECGHRAHALDARDRLELVHVDFGEKRRGELERGRRGWGPEATRREADTFSRQGKARWLF